MNGLDPKDWRFIPPEAMTLLEYPCGIRAGMILRLRQELVYRDHLDQPTGEVRPVGDEAMVMSGNLKEPDVIWLRWHDAPHSQTWDLTWPDWFDAVEAKNRNPSIVWWWQ